MATLRDGSKVVDPRLDFISQKDERSRNYSAVDLLSTDQTEPRFRGYFVARWLDQGAEGACVGYSVAHELCSTPIRMDKWKNINDQFARNIYHRAQHVDPWDGCAWGRNCTIEPSSYKYEGTSMLAGMKIAKETGYIDEYRWAFGEEDLAVSISHLGPAVIGINWYEGMFSPNRHGFIEPTGRWMGGHAIVVNAINPREGRDYYRLWNSWGRSWGRNGWCYLSREHMDQLLQEDGEAAIPLVRQSTPQ